MKIYGARQSPFVARIILACDHKEISYSLDIPEGGLRSPEFLAISPFGKAPAVLDGDTALFESGVIVSYLDEKYPENKLIPVSPLAAVKARTIAAICDLYVQPHAMILWVQASGRMQKDPVMIEKAKADMAMGLGVLDNFITSVPCAVDNEFTIADCYAIPALMIAAAAAPFFGIRNPFEAQSNVEKYFKVIADHPSATMHMIAVTEIIKDRLKSFPA